MLPPPTLTREDLTGLLQQLARGGDRHRPLLAVYGVADGPLEPVTTSFGRHRIVAVDCELNLRRSLPAPGVRAEPTIFLVPWTEPLPPDIAGRFAQNGAILRVQRDVRILQLLQHPPSEWEPEVIDCALASYLLRRRPDPLPFTGGRLTRDGLWDAWLEQSWGIRFSEAGLDLLLAWVATNGFGPRFDEIIREGAGLAQEFDALLARRYGHLGPRLLRAWRAGRGRDALAFAVLCEALRGQLHQDGPRTWLFVHVRTVFGQDITPDAVGALAELLASLVSPAFLRLEERIGDRTALREALLRAEELADAVVRPYLGSSNRLPVAWALRLDALGSALSEGAENLNRQALARAQTALRALEQHDFFRRDAEQSRVAVERANMAVRLMAWLIEYEARPLGSALDPAATAERHARWYCEEGGYVDWARDRARGGDSDRFGRGVQAIVARADSVRDALDAQFARVLPDWSLQAERRLASSPIEQALDRIAVPFLAEHPERRLLVLLLDGMGWKEAAEVLESLAQANPPWLPLTWHNKPDRAIGDGPFPPVFAAFPTVTMVSRAAFFAGKRQEVGRNPSTGDDPKRLRDHRGLKKIVPGAVAPPLRLRDAFTADGSVGVETQNLIRDDQHRLVAVVINAIDASLKRDPQHATEWRARNVGPLLDLLQAAREAGRVVLLASDHGNVSGDRIESIPVRGERGGTRWRPWDGLETAGPNELVLSTAAWYPRGAQGVVMLVGERFRYQSGSKHEGEHGGAALSEVVAPTVLLGWEGLERTAPGAQELSAHAVPPPRWWYFDIPPSTPIVPAKRRSTSTRKTPPQLEIAAMQPPAPEAPSAPPPPPTPPRAREPAAPRPSLHPLAAKLRDSAVFRALAVQDPDAVVAAVSYLLQQGGSNLQRISVGEEPFAAALGLPNKSRTRGHVAHLAEALNVDAFPVITFNVRTREVVLDAELLRQCFEVSE